MKPVDLRSAVITDAFWSRTQELVRREMIPYQWNALNDLVADAAPSFCMHNFRAAQRLNRRRGTPGFAEPVYANRGFQRWPEDPSKPDPDAFYGFVFQDTDLYKWLEAVAYSLSVHPDAALEAVADEAIATVCGAQLENGYLDTYYILNGMDRAFTNLRGHHELYCLGHLTEAAVAYYESTGKDALLRAACRFADFVDSRFGPEPEKCKGYPGHEIAEMALVRLSEATGDEKYLRLSRFFVDQRGTQPHYFVAEEQENARYEGRAVPNDIDVSRHAYAQAHKPVREQEEAVGHSVRAVYLYSGMADLARVTGDETLRAACRRLWHSITREKLYLTGGIGGTNVGEAFSYPYDLPNDTAYSETCAAIGLVFFARRMLQLEAKSEYADVMEQALYNTVLSGMALDGKSFFYVNPLEVLPEACRRDERKHHVKSVRQKWFGCACCPPNLARLVESLAAYAFTETKDALFVHLYLSGKVTKRIGERSLTVSLETQMPWDGKTTVRVEAKEPVALTLAFRIPGWCGKEMMRISSDVPYEIRDGYLYFSGTWAGCTAITLDFPMKTRIISADPKVQENIGKAAVMRGPLVYCAEEADNGTELHRFRLDAERIASEGIEFAEAFDPEIRGLDVPAKRLCGEAEALYVPYRLPREEETHLRMIPYYAWANRGEGEMSVWFRI